MTIAALAPMSTYAIGFSDRTCEITPEMQSVLDANSRALSEMLASPRDGTIPVRYHVVEINASQVGAPVLRPDEASIPQNSNTAS